jgi:hypothetical protein
VLYPQLARLHAAVIRQRVDPTEDTIGEIGGPVVGHDMGGSAGSPASGSVRREEKRTMKRSTVWDEQSAYAPRRVEGGTPAASKVGAWGRVLIVAGRRR